MPRPSHLWGANKLCLRRQRTSPFPPNVETSSRRPSPRRMFKPKWKTVDRRVRVLIVDA